MKIFKDTGTLQRYVSKIKLNSKKIGFVPTMGAIHKGHLTLIEKSKRQNDITIVSIFVNPKQFNNLNDFLRYPQNIQVDIDKIGNLADILFIPGAESIYKKSNQTTFSFSELDKILEGKYRPGHFQGVALIVCKLLNICQPDLAYFGLKDYQQYLVIKQLVEDLNIQTKIIGVTTGGPARNASRSEAGGKLAQKIRSGEICGVIVDPGDTNPSGYPKSGLGLSFGALFGSLIKSGVLNYSEDDLLTTLSELEEIRKLWNVKDIAKQFEKQIPVLFSSKSLLGPLNAGRNAMCEIGRTFTLFFDFPEVNHVLIEATLKPDFVKEKVKYLFFESEFDHPRIKLRYKITKEIFDKQGLSYQSYTLCGKTKLTQVLEIPHYCAWLGFYLSMLEGVDPGPEPWIIELKNLLSQPVH